MRKIGIRTETIKKTFAQRVQEIAKGREGLVQKEVEVRRGGKTFKQKRWVRPGEETQKPGASKTVHDTNKIAGIQQQFFNGKINREQAKEALLKEGVLPKYVEGELKAWESSKYYKKGKDNKKLGIRKPGQVNEAGDVKRGDKVSGVDVNGEKVSGTVTGVGNDGVTIDSTYHVEHGKVVIENEKKAQQEKSKQVKPKDNKKQPVKQGKTFVPPEKFNASEWSKQWVDPEATPDDAGVEHILKSFGKDGKEISEKIEEINNKLKGRPQTWQHHRMSGVGESAIYSPERKKLHTKIMKKLLRPNKLRSALPENGESPTFMILGGRGGSGKSWFEKNVYDPSKYVILDADKIKEEIPEYEGWNAYDVHEESSDILELMLAKCIKRGLNVVLDGTMKTATSAMAKVLRVKAAGYKTEAHYMHLPKEEAAKRAIGRFKDGGEKDKPFSGRYVPVSVILGNTTNEESFDQVKGLVDSWSFRDNNVEKRGDPPIIISESKNVIKKSFASIVKSIIMAYN